MNDASPDTGALDKASKDFQKPIGFTQQAQGWGGGPRR